MALNGKILGTASAIEFRHETELRHLPENVIYKLALILDENDSWRRLMEIIPKHLDARMSKNSFDYEALKAMGGLKYKKEDFDNLLTAYERMPADTSISQLMIDEWKIAGRMNQRPTLGLLLKLLIHAQLFRAADYVAVQLLNEPKPERPAEGPARKILLESLSAEIRENMEVDTNDDFMPSTGTLNAHAHCDHTISLNKDYYEKAIRCGNKNIINNSDVNQHNAPIPLPRQKRISSRLEKPLQHQHQLQKNNITPLSQDNKEPQRIISNTNSSTNTENEQDENAPNIPNLTMLRNISSNAHHETSALLAIPMTTTSATKEDCSSNSLHMETDESCLRISEDIAPIPLVTLLLDNNTINGESSSSAVNAAVQSASKDVDVQNHENSSADSDSLPILSALNVLGERDDQDAIDGAVATPSSNEEQSSSISNDGDVDDDDISLPNLSNFEQRSSNNDSSLTTVTGTSGDNSFELTNDSSSTSNEDNIPCLSALNP